MISFSGPVTTPGSEERSADSSGERAPAAGPFTDSTVPHRRAALAVWGAIIVAGFGVGAILRSTGHLPVDRFPPLHADPRLLIGPLLPAVVVGLVAVAVLPIAARRLPWRSVLLTAWLGSALWAVALQLPDGLARPLTAPTEYLAGLPAIGDDPLRWLRGFAGAMQAYPTHVKGHPPLPTLILWALQRAGLRDAGWAAALVITAGSSAVAAIAITVRRLAGADAARRAVPFVVLAPTALWVATSMDALFLGVAAWAVALVTIAATRPAPDGFEPVATAHDEPASVHSPPVHSPPALSAPGDAALRGLPPLRSTPGDRGPGTRGGAALGCAFAGGLLLGSLPYLSYGLLPMFALPLAVLVLTRPPRAVLGALAAGCVVVPAAFTLAGFSWFEGVAGTHTAWAAGGGARARPYAYFLVGDVSVLALLIGPATAMALPTVLRHTAALAKALLPGGPADPGENRWRGTGRGALRWRGAGHSMLRWRGAERAEYRPAGAGHSAFRWRGAGGERVAAEGPGGSVWIGRLGWPVAAALAGMIALDLSGVTRGEVERIWIPYAAWTTIAPAVVRPPARTLLLAQVATALVIQALARSPW
ncbi:hypothetical protein GCM10023196_094410 [Actinoallomurus vinaceus]|uniref:Integral membrane protein n=1 Tax=Actinoallomurus vinaceus TaxID=1080074 RepID=A0ABP8UT80_9ACTN